MVAEHALTPATRLSLGELLPHQQADRTQAPLKAPKLYSKTPKWLETIEYYPIFRWAVPDFKAGYLRVTHPFATIQKEKSSAEASEISKDRSTCIPKAHSQRSSWAMIKLSLKNVFCIALEYKGYIVS